MATLAQIRTALKTTIESGVATEIFAYDKVPDVEVLPAVVVEPLSANYEGAFQRGMDTWEFYVFVLCSRGDTEQGQETLDGFVSGFGPDSIKQAVYANPSLGLSNTDAEVYEMRGYGGSPESNNIPLVGAVLKVRVHTDGSA